MTAALSDYLLFQCRYINILTYLLTYLHQEFYQPLNVAYIDIKAAFDSVDRAALWKAVRSSGAPPFLIQLTEHLHTGTTSRVRVGGQLSVPFETTSRIRQGCVVAPALFCIAIDWIVYSCAGTMGTTVGSSKFTDEIHCPSMWPHILSSFDEAAHTMGLNTSWLKTKIQNLGRGVTPAPVQLQGHVVESTDRFTYMYLGSDIHSSERSTPDILRRIGLASNIFVRLANVWKRTGLSLHYRRRYGFAMPLSSPHCYMARRHGLS